MTIAELLAQLEKIRQERMLESHHDMLFQSYPDIEALDRVINLTKILDESKSSDRIKISELLSAAQIEK